jgi:hypothetical protein
LVPRRAVPQHSAIPSVTKPVHALSGRAFALL